jgi:DNA-binding transcriptional LysR family regulator
VTQPSLSQSVRKLEHDLGLELFFRVGWGRVLAPTGEAFVGRRPHGSARGRCRACSSSSACPAPRIGGRHAYPSQRAVRCDPGAGERGTATRDYIEQTLRTPDVEPRIVAEVRLRGAVLPMVLAGGAITIIPLRVALDARCQGGGLRELTPGLSMGIETIHRSAKLASATSQFLAFAKQSLKSTGRRHRRMRRRWPLTRRRRRANG